MNAVRIIAFLGTLFTFWFLGIGIYALLCFVAWQLLPIPWEILRLVAAISVVISLLVASMINP